MKYEEMTFKYKVALLHNILAPYRVPLFEKLSQIPFINLKVFFLSESEKNRRWKVKKNFKFTYEVLPGISLNFKSEDLFSYWINPTIIYHLIGNKFDVVISSGWDSFTSQASFFTCKLLGKPFILWSESTINERNWRRTVSLPLVKFMVRHSDAYIAIGTRAKKYFTYLRAKPQKIFIAYSTVDVEYFKNESNMLKEKRDKLKEKMGIKTNSVIMYSGQLIERKGLFYLLQAYKELRKDYQDISLLIVGYGPQEERLKEVCKKENIQNVFFTGFIDYNNLPGCYVISDLFVLPSFEETWGLVINEAMACGLPIITTAKVGASADLVKEGINGYIIEEKNIAQLYEAMKKIVLNQSLQKKMGEQSRKIIENFGIDNQVSGFVSAIKYVIENRGSS